MPGPPTLKFSEMGSLPYNTGETSSGQHVIMPNRAPSTRNPYTVLVEVSSRDRNYNNQIGSNPLRFQFARPLKDVRSVELLGGTIPANPFCINDKNNKFTFQEGTSEESIDSVPPNYATAGAVSWAVTIPPATYTPTTLINTLVIALNSLPNKQNTYTASISSNTGNLILATTNPDPVLYSFLFASGIYQDMIDRSDGYFLQMNTVAMILGFDLSDYTSEPDGTLISPFPVDINTALNRLYLFINFDNSQNLGCIERGAGRKSPFAIIYLDQQTNGYKYLNKDTITAASYSLPQPHSRLQLLNIEFRDEFYRLIDFNGKDFSLLLQLTLLE